MDLMTLTDAELIALGCRLNGGTFGRDAARMDKLAKVAHIRDVAHAKYPSSPNPITDQAALSILAARKTSTKPGGNGALVTGPQGPTVDAQDDDAVTLPDGSTMAAQGAQGPTQPFKLDVNDSTLFQDANASDGDGSPTDDQRLDAAIRAAARSPKTGNDAKPDPNAFEHAYDCTDPKCMGGCDGRPGSTGGDNKKPNAGDGDAFGDPDDQEPDSNPSDAPTPSQGTKADTLEARVREMIAEAMGDASDNAAEEIAEAVEARLTDAVAAIRQDVMTQSPRQTVVTLKAPNLPAIDCGPERHPTFAKAFALLSLPKELRHGWGLGLVGPMGSTKTTLSKQLADALGAAGFGAVSCSADMTRGVIDGRILPIGDGRYVPSGLIKIAEESAANPTARYIYSLDELDRSAPEVIVALHAALSNGGLHAEPRSFADLPIYVDFGDLTFIAQMNTHGTGGSTQYASATLQDGAMMDRWLMLFVDHPYALWARTMGAQDLYDAPKPWQPMQRTDAELAEAMRHAFSQLHDMAVRVASTGIDRTISFRACLKARACLCAGFSWDDTLDVILAGWDADQRAQVLG